MNLELPHNLSLKNSYLRKLLIGLCLLTNSAFAQSKTEQVFSLSGNFQKETAGKLYLFNNSNEPVDSVLIKNNRFNFRGKLSEPGLYMLKIDTVPNTYPIFLEGSPIQVVFNKDGTYKVTGSRLHDQWQRYNGNFTNPIREQLIKLFEERNKAQNQGDTVRFNRLMKQNDSVSIYWGSRRTDFVAQKPFTFFNLFLLKEGGFEDSYIRNMLTEFSSQLASYPSYKLLDQQLKTKEIQLQRVAVGNKAYNFTLPDSLGVVHSLMPIRKKLLLIDFWASWCGSCIVQMPALKKLYETYADQGLEVIGISVDDDRKRWLQAARRYQPAGLQLLAAKNELLKENYAIYGIPQTYLIDQTGTIIGHNLEGEELRKKIAEVLQNNR